MLLVSPRSFRFVPHSICFFFPSIFNSVGSFFRSGLARSSRLIPHNNLFSPHPFEFLASFCHHSRDSLFLGIHGSGIDFMNGIYTYIRDHLICGDGLRFKCAGGRTVMHREKMYSKH